MVFNINVLEGKWVLFYISSLDNVSDQDISRLKEVYEGIEKHNKCVIVWIPVVEDWTGGGEEQFKEWRYKMPWYAVQYFSPPAIGYLDQRWNFKGNPMVVVMNRKGKVAIGNIIDMIRTQATEAIALLNVEIQKEIRVHHACTATTAEAVEVLKCLTCPRQITNTDATPVLLDGSNNQVNIDNELKWKDLFLLLSDVGIEDLYISYLKPVYEGIRRYPSYRIVWVPVVKQWNQDKENQFEMSRLKMPWYTLKCFSTKPDMKYMKKKWKYKGKPAVVVMTSAGMVKNKNAFPMIKERGMAAFPFFE
ncbi:hypothetical protein C1H46_014448 [Malus baccata]|uniref:Thioredoxin-like fold domain-containing protein n=1 Tax=Malus baccata TaxID=106549 RepID=A0A540MMF7_MALBA|nr:hypothetical protein C1H46_014448 [Malus baccata]